jgi:hypothetical protein
MLAKHCSKEWKTRVIVREIRRILGLAPGQRGRETVEVWIGISREEAHRVKPSEVPWIANRWPLVDMALRRGHCVQWLQSHGYPVPPRSACVYCPYQSDDEFAGMKSNHVDDDWSRAVAFDDAIRPGGISTTGPLYVSRHRKALAEIEFEDVPDLFGNECEGMCGV